MDSRDSDTHDFASAERLLLDEIDRDPHSQRAARMLSFAGQCLLLNGDFLNAAIAWKKSDAIAPLEPSAKFSLAMVYIHLGRPEWARPILQALTESDTKVALYPYWLGRLEYDSQHYKSAISRFEQALAIDPQMSRAYDNLGLCYFYLNDTPRAIEDYQRAIDLDRNSPRPSAWPHLNLAIAFQFVNRLDDAEEQLREAIKLDPKLAQAQYQLGMVLEARDHLDSAVSALAEAATLDPSYAEPHFALARIYRKQGKSAIAEQEVATYRLLHSKQRTGAGMQAR